MKEKLGITKKSDYNTLKIYKQVMRNSMIGSTHIDNTVHSAFSSGSAGRHETFTPRHGWLKKGYDRCVANPHVFNDDNSIEQLGVGKNMVRSIRFWCSLFKLLKSSDEPGCLQPTSFGIRLLDTNTGWDPYLEDPASLWLLHWQIFLPPLLGVSWPIAFNFAAMSAFDISELCKSVISKTKEYGNLKVFSDSSYEKDSSCILRMYYSDEKEKSEIKSPFSDLNLIIPILDMDRKRFRFNTNEKPTLPDLIFLAAVFSYAYKWFPAQRTLSLNQIAYGINSPGVAFKLSETDCGTRIERAIQNFKNVSLIDASGIRQIQFSLSADDLYWKCIELYYEEHV